MHGAWAHGKIVTEEFRSRRARRQCNCESETVYVPAVHHCSSIMTGSISQCERTVVSIILLSYGRSSFITNFLVCGSLLNCSVAGVCADEASLTIVNSGFCVRACGFLA
eukprot:4996434-Pyramimonas_sp.AAC.1